MILLRIMLRKLGLLPSTCCLAVGKHFENLLVVGAGSFASNVRVLSYVINTKRFLNFIGNVHYQKYLSYFRI